MVLVYCMHPFLENVKFQKYIAKMAASAFEKPGFQKQIFGCNKYAKYKHHNLYFISENMQEMGRLHSTD